jgi:hypothetical protein
MRHMQAVIQFDGTAACRGRLGLPVQMQQNLRQVDQQFRLLAMTPECLAQALVRTLRPTLVQAQRRFQRVETGGRRRLEHMPPIDLAPGFGNSAFGHETSHTKIQCVDPGLAIRHLQSVMRLTPAALQHQGAGQIAGAFVQRHARLG